MTNNADTPRIPKKTVGTLDIDLVPGLRNRLIAEMGPDVPAGPASVHLLTELSGRTIQSALRWIADEKPGLPDLRSLAILCLQFGVDANWILGLTEQRLPFPFNNINNRLHRQAWPDRQLPVNWIGHVMTRVGLDYPGARVMIMRGDDMAPLIREGAPVFFDDAVSTIDLNGVYLLEYQGKTLVRHVEIRIGEGLLLRCENERYGSTIIANNDIGAAIDMVVLGKVIMAVNIVAL